MNSLKSLTWVNDTEQQQQQQLFFFCSRQDMHGKLQITHTQRGAATAIAAAAAATQQELRDKVSDGSRLQNERRRARQVKPTRSRFTNVACVRNQFKVN